MKPGAPGSSGFDVARWRDGAWSNARDVLADEVPIALEYNGIAHAVMLATPCDLEAFALGFSLSEGIIVSRREFHGAEVDDGVEPVADKTAIKAANKATTGITVRIEVSSAAFARLKERRRNLTGRTGCGLCGTESLDQAIRPLPSLAGNGLRIAVPALLHALDTLRGAQPLQQITGATHAAAWCRPDGAIALVREDVGRHNALDKLIGALAMQDADFSSGFALITSRASVEMVQKSATLGIGVLAAISAPTSLAVQTARQIGMTLIGFARGQEFVAYSHPERLLP